MSRIINVSIDLNSISKDKIKNHANGAAYYNFSVLEKKETDAYGNTHFCVEAQTKEERDAKAPKNYLKSSGKLYVFGENANGTQQVASNSQDSDDDDLPF